MLEVRPWLEQEVTVGYFEIKKDLNCVDVSNDKKGYYIQLDPDTVPSPKICEEQIWSRINDSFSRPVATEEDQIHYIPTQYLSEQFKVAGYDGIIYKSALTEKGYNIVLFNQSDAKFSKAQTFEIKSIKQTYSECTPPHICKCKDKAKE